MPKKAPKLVSIATWAEECAITVWAARKRIKSLGIPVVDGMVDRGEANRLVALRIDVRKQRGTQCGEPSEELSAARCRRESAKADTARIEADALAGSMVRKQDVMRWWTAMIGPAKTRFTALGAKLGPALAIEQNAATCQALVDAAVYEALLETSKFNGVESQ